MFAFEGRSPRVSASAWIAPTATLVGDVTVEDEASVWYGAVLRAGGGGGGGGGAGEGWKGGRTGCGSLITEIRKPAR